MQGRQPLHIHIYHPRTQLQRPKAGAQTRLDCGAIAATRQRRVERQQADVRNGRRNELLHQHLFVGIRGGGGVFTCANIQAPKF